MILKLTYGGVTELIECDEIRCDHRVAASIKQMEDYMNEVGLFTFFGAPDPRHKTGEGVAPYRCCHISVGNNHGKDSSRWQHIFAVDSGVFIMNESGKTLEVVSR